MYGNRLDERKSQSLIQNSSHLHFSALTASVPRVMQIYNSHNIASLSFRALCAIIR